MIFLSFRHRQDSFDPDRELRRYPSSRTNHDGSGKPAESGQSVSDRAYIPSFATM
ncbi:hypothetical protein [Bradyrhizobium sp. USDA 4454]